MDPGGIETALGKYLAEQPHGAYAAYLFGSVARQDAGAESDIDVAVLLEAGAPQTLDDLPLALEQDLRELLGFPVDVVVLDTAPPDLFHRILRDGHIVLDRDRKRRIAFEVRARSLYLDLRPVLDRYRRSPNGNS
jgi:predicted nucleotidyltransferase